MSLLCIYLFSVVSGVNALFWILWLAFFKNIYQVTELNWTEVQGWAGAGGARLRTTRSVFCVFIVKNSVNINIH